MVVKSQYVCSMQVDTNWYWNQQPKQHVITVTTRTILHPQLEVNTVTYFHAIHTSVCTSTQEKNSNQNSLYVWLILNMIKSYKKLVVKTKLSLKYMWKFIVSTRKINMRILNDCCIFLSYIYILTMIWIFLFFLVQH